MSLAEMYLDENYVAEPETVASEMLSLALTVPLLSQVQAPDHGGRGSGRPP